MLIPAMDTHNGTLKALLDTLSSKNDLQGWNMYQNKCGNIVVKIRFGDRTGDSDQMNNQDTNTVQNLSYKKMTSKQNDRNFLRTKAFREGNQNKRQRQNSPIENARTENCISSSTPNVNMEFSQCNEDESLLNQSLDHDTDVSQNTECVAGLGDGIPCDSGDAEEYQDACSDADIQTPCTDGDQAKRDDALDRLRSVLDGAETSDGAINDALSTLRSLPIPDDPVARVEYYKALLYDENGRFKPGFNKLYHTHTSWNLTDDGYWTLY